MMDNNLAPKCGLEATDKLLVLYKQLLSILGGGNLLYEKTKEDTHNIPKKCEDTNQVVAEILKSMKELLLILREAYSICNQDKKFENVQLEDILQSSSNNMQVEKTEEYNKLYKELQMKNKEIKDIIHEVREIFNIISKLSEI